MAGSVNQNETQIVTFIGIHHHVSLKGKIGQCNIRTFDTLHTKILFSF